MVSGLNKGAAQSFELGSIIKRGVKNNKVSLTKEASNCISEENNSKSQILSSKPLRIIKDESDN